MKQNKVMLLRKNIVELSSDTISELSGYADYTSTKDFSGGWIYNLSTVKEILSDIIDCIDEEQEKQTEIIQLQSLIKEIEDAGCVGLLLLK